MGSTYMLLRNTLSGYWGVNFGTQRQFKEEYLNGDYNEIVLKNGLIAKLARTRKDAFLALF